MKHRRRGLMTMSRKHMDFKVLGRLLGYVIRHYKVACLFTLIFIILAWPSGERWDADGERRRSSDILAQVLISIPTGQGMQ